MPAKSALTGARRGVRRPAARPDGLRLFHTLLLSGVSTLDLQAQAPNNTVDSLLEP
jgi:hypothetical protein